MIMNTKPIINQKKQLFSTPAPAADWCHLQHPRTLMGLSRKRFCTGRCPEADRQAGNPVGLGHFPQRRRRPEVRIWRESLLAYLARESGGGGPAAAPERTFAHASHRSHSAQAACHAPARGHCARPGDAKTISLLPDTPGRPDRRRRVVLCRPDRPRETPAVLYQSVFEFLKRRSMSV